MLRNLILSYRTLMDTQYKFTITQTVSKQTTEKYIELSFTEPNFHHLIGLHKLKGIDKVKCFNANGAQKIYNQILGNHITFYDLDKDTSQHKAAFLSRATSLNLIYTMLENISVNLKGLYYFAPNKIGSKIKAKYLLHFQHRDKEFYFLFDKYDKKVKNTDICYPVSVFRRKIQAELPEGRSAKHYEMSQTPIKLLKVEKIQGARIVTLYDR